MPDPLSESGDTASAPVPDSSPVRSVITDTNSARTASVGRRNATFTGWSGARPANCG